MQVKMLIYDTVSWKFIFYLIARNYSSITDLLLPPAPCTVITKNNTDINRYLCDQQDWRYFETAPGQFSCSCNPPPAPGNLTFGRNWFGSPVFPVHFCTKSLLCALSLSRFLFSPPYAPPGHNIPGTKWYPEGEISLLIANFPTRTGYTR